VQYTEERRKRREKEKQKMTMMMMMMIRWGQYCHHLCSFLAVGSNEEELTRDS
jgi:hypothetical protein